MIRMTSQTGCGSTTRRPSEGTPHSARIASVPAIPRADSSTHARVGPVVGCLNVRMECQPSDLQRAGKARRGLLSEVVGGHQTGRPGRGPDESASGLKEHVIAQVVVATAAVNVEPDAPAEQCLADDQGAVVD